MEKTQLAKLRVDFVRNLLAKGQREDGRGFNELRDVKLDVGFVPRANGSCYVHLGRTKVLAGVKVQVETPYPDTPNRGNFMTSCEMSPMASPNFEAGPPSIEAIEVARVTDRAMRESGIVDLGALCIEPKEKVWGIFVDLEILDYDGNLFDACSIAALAALLSTKLPAVCPKTKIQVYKEDQPVPLKLDDATFSITFVKIGDAILTDPCLDEELVADTRITIGVDASGATRSMQKGGFGAWTMDEVRMLRARATEHVVELLDVIKEAAGLPFDKKARDARRKSRQQAQAKQAAAAKKEAEAEAQRKAAAKPKREPKQDAPAAKAAPQPEPRAVPQSAPAVVDAALPKHTQEELSKLTVAKLKELAKNDDVKIPSGAKKADLVSALYQAYQALAEAANQARAKQAKSGAAGQDGPAKRPRRRGGRGKQGGAPEGDKGGQPPRGPKPDAPTGDGDGASKRPRRRGGRRKPSQ